MVLEICASVQYLSLLAHTVISFINTSYITRLYHLNTLDWQKEKKRKKRGIECIYFTNTKIIIYKSMEKKNIPFKLIL